MKKYVAILLSLLYQLAGASGASLDDAGLMEQMQSFFGQNELV